jgi:hypothetical protein
VIAGDVDAQPEVPIRRTEPSWLKVLSVTAQLWLSRRLGRLSIGWPLLISTLTLAVATTVALGVIYQPKQWTPRQLMPGAISAAATVVMLALIVLASYLRRARGRHRRIRIGLAGVSVRILTALAAALAGRTGSVLLRESDAHLAGQSGHDVANWAKLKQAAGFVLAGIRYRGQDWADTSWKPVEAVLRSRALSAMFVSVPTIVVAMAVLRAKGTITVFTSFGSIFGIGVALAGAVKYGRRYRGIKLAGPKTGQTED